MSGCQQVAGGFSSGSGLWAGEGSGARIQPLDLGDLAELYCLARPSVGSWVLYGLGTENRDLPGFVTIKPPMILGGARNYGSAFLPSSFQGTPIGTMKKPLKSATIAHTTHPSRSLRQQRRQLDFVHSLNQDLTAKQTASDQLENVIESYELAFRMQSGLPRLMDFSEETQATLDLYGIGDGKKTDNFGRQCLLARRLAENDVRFIELTHDNWDHHGFVSRLMPQNSLQVDQPILTDLRQRGLLDGTLVVWGGEFGRTPDDPRGDGRGHQPQGFTMWLASGGTKAGTVYGATDELAFGRDRKRSPKRL